MACEVRLAAEDEDRFDACCGGSFEAHDVGDVKVYVVVYVYQVRCGNRGAVGLEDTTILSCRELHGALVRVSRCGIVVWPVPIGPA